MKSFNILALSIVAALAGSLGGCSSQATFDSPQQAVDALFDATRARDRQALRHIFGERAGELLTGDPEQDEADFQRFAAALERHAELTPEKNGQMSLLIGPDLVPFVTPLVRESSKWRFDTDAGVEEVITRRIGRNELNVIKVSRLYALAQFEYYVIDPDNDGVRTYAANIRSAKGKRDGLYWPDDESDPDAPASPLGPLFAEAAAAGDVDLTKAARQPYHGYYFRILTRQGAAAPGGARNYVDESGRMSRGHALLAWPEAYNVSGVMSFLVDMDGNVYEKDLGENSDVNAARITEFNPEGWRKVAQ